MTKTLLASVAALAVIVIPTTAATFHITTSDISSETQSVSQDWCKDGPSYNDRDETFCEVRELKEAGQGRLEAQTSNGSLSVTGTARRDVVVQARVIAYASSVDEARNIARDVQVTLEGGRLRAQGPDQSRRRTGWHVSYRVEVPNTYDLSLDTSNGSIGVVGVRGQIEAESSNGSVRLTDLGGRVRARTSNGAVHIQASGSRWEGEGLSVTTSNGSASLDLPQSFNANLIVGTSNGSLDLDFPVMVQGRIGKQLETTLGSGGPTLEVRTSNGSVRVRRR